MRARFLWLYEQPRSVLANLLVHPLDDTSTGSGPVQFATEFPTAGRYRLFLQFQVDGRVETVAFTQEVGR